MVMMCYPVFAPHSARNGANSAWIFLAGVYERIYHTGILSLAQRGALVCGTSLAIMLALWYPGPSGS